AAGSGARRPVFPGLRPAHGPLTRSGPPDSYGSTQRRMHEAAFEISVRVAGRGAGDYAIARRRAGREPTGAVQEGRDRADGRADRALSRRARGADPDGCDLSARNRAGGALGEGESGPQGEGAGRRDGKAELGPEREIAHRVSAGAGDAERESRYDAEPRRRLPRAAEGGAGGGATAARQGRPGGEPEIGQGTDRHQGAGRWPDGDQDRAGQSA